MRPGTFLVGVLAGAISLLPIQVHAQSIKPTAGIEIAFVPERQEGWVHQGELKLGASLGVEDKIKDKLFYFVKGRGELYTDFSKVNYAQASIEGGLRYNNLALFLSYVYGGSAANYDLTNVLTIGTRFALGDKPKRDSESLELNTHGTLEIGYTPFRYQYASEQFNELKTRASGTAELDYEGLFAKFSGAFTSYENRGGFLQFDPNIQEYLTKIGLGYKIPNVGEMELYFLGQCAHAVAFAEGELANVDMTSTGGYVTTQIITKDSNKDPHLVNQESRREFGLDFNF